LPALDEEDEEDDDELRLDVFFNPPSSNLRFITVRTYADTAGQAGSGIRDNTSK
jgi:hypothetical protein